LQTILSTIFLSLGTEKRLQIDPRTGEIDEEHSRYATVEDTSCLSRNLCLLGDHDCTRHASIVEENRFEAILVVAGVYQDQESL
jgi:hypothetical protein